jgi:hypothetical protein
MAISIFDQPTDGTVKASSWVGLLFQLIMLAETLQGRYNRAKPKNKIKLIEIDKKYDGEIATMTAKITFQGQRVTPPNSIRPELKLDSVLTQYLVDENNQPIAFDGGTGPLTGVTTIEEALQVTAEYVSVLESQIEPDQLIKEVNIVNANPDPEDGILSIEVSIPLRNSWDIAEGKSMETPKNYLYLLDVDGDTI